MKLPRIRMTTRVWIVVVAVSAVMLNAWVSRRVRLVAAGRSRLASEEKYYGEGRIPIERWCEASRQLMEAECALYPWKSARIASIEAHLSRTEKIYQQLLREPSCVHCEWIIDVVEAEQFRDDAGKLLADELRR